MIIIDTDNVKIYDLLENTGNLFSDFSSDKAVMFDSEDDFYVVLFLSASRNFISFKAENYLQKTDALASLLEEICDYTDPALPVSLVDQAVRLIENKLNSDNSHFYFDAH